MYASSRRWHARERERVSYGTMENEVQGFMFLSKTRILKTRKSLPADCRIQILWILTSRILLLFATTATRCSARFEIFALNFLPLALFSPISPILPGDGETRQFFSSRLSVGRKGGRRKLFNSSQPSGKQFLLAARHKYEIRRRSLHPESTPERQKMRAKLFCRGFFASLFVAASLLPSGDRARTGGSEMPIA